MFAALGRGLARRTCRRPIPSTDDKGRERSQGPRRPAQALVPSASKVNPWQLLGQLSFLSQGAVTGLALPDEERMSCTPRLPDRSNNLILLLTSRSRVSWHHAGRTAPFAELMRAVRNERRGRTRSVSQSNDRRWQIGEAVCARHRTPAARRRPFTLVSRKTARRRPPGQRSSCRQGGA
jgi:hypothetical protein